MRLIYARVPALIAKLGFVACLGAAALAAIKFWSFAVEPEKPARISISGLNREVDLSFAGTNANDPHINNLSGAVAIAGDRLISDITGKLIDSSTQDHCGTTIRWSNVSVSPKIGSERVEIAATVRLEKWQCIKLETPQIVCKNSEMRLPFGKYANGPKICDTKITLSLQRHSAYAREANFNMSMSIKNDAGPHVVLDDMLAEQDELTNIVNTTVARIAESALGSALQYATDFADEAVITNLKVKSRDRAYFSLRADGKFIVKVFFTAELPAKDTGALQKWAKTNGPSL